MMDSRKLRSQSYDDIPLVTKVKNPFSRTAQAPRYYIVDFGLSRRYSFDNLYRTDTCLEGKDDPFSLDVYCLGNVIQRRILEVSSMAFSIFRFLNICLEIYWLRVFAAAG